MTNNMTLETTETTRELTIKYDFPRFSKFLDNFQQSEIWKSMESTVEDSPWHREANVAVHTMMALDQAQKWFPIVRSSISDRHIILTKLAILFHDTGKPPMQEVKENKERGVYRSYANHEQRSARIFEAYVVDNWTEWFDGWITHEDVYVVTWIIEHHLPYGVKNKNKINTFVSSLLALPQLLDIDIFFNAIRGDAYGRISDNWDTNIAAVEEWISDTIKQMREYLPTQLAMINASDKLTKEVVFLVAPPGAGKSSTRILFEDYAVFNLDDLRVQFYREDPTYLAESDPVAEYALAFSHAMNNEASFKQYAMAVATNLFANNNKILMDNTNVSVKSRRPYLELARQNKFFTSAVYFPTSARLLHQRNDIRQDKKLPYTAIENLFNAVALPSRGGEFHSVVIAPSNYGS